MSWNPVMNKFIEIKNEFHKRMGYITYNMDEKKTCLELWVECLNSIEPINQYSEYADLLSRLELNQNGHFLLLRYGQYSDIYNGEIDNSGEELWSIYDGFYRECRSIVIDIVNDKIVLCPFAKFFNINELEETSLENIQSRIDNAKTVEFSNKLDGSMQSATWYNGQIIMAGSQSIDPNMSWRLQDGYKMIYQLPGYEQMLREYPDITFVFEYISLKDTHVVKYTKEQEGLYLIGMRSNLTGEEYSYESILKFAKLYNIPTTEIFNKTLDDVMTELDDKSSDEAEGFVINIDGYKVKLKYNDYVHIHKVLSKLSSINLVISSIADSCYDDLLSKLPKAYHENVKKIATVVMKYITETTKNIKQYYDTAPKTNKKDFMIYVSENVPKEYQVYCRELYYGHDINVLKSGNKKSPRYKKLKEMGVDDYSMLFKEELKDV